MADAGLMYFRPTEKEPTCFLVTETGAMGTHLEETDGFFMQTFFGIPAAPARAYVKWREAVR
jgi:hypothetical protein